MNSIQLNPLKNQTNPKNPFDLYNQLIQNTQILKKFVAFRNNTTLQYIELDGIRLKVSTILFSDWVRWCIENYNPENPTIELELSEFQILN